MAKPSHPVHRGTCLRYRLFEQLDRMRAVPTIWVSAPAGSGKTTLISSYMEHSGAACLWYDLNEGDADIATFFHHLSQTAQRAASRGQKPLPLLTPEYLQGVPTFTRGYFERLFGMFKPPFFLVLDDYHEVPLDSAFHEVMGIALAMIPEGANTVIISRRDPPAQLMRMKANRHMDMLGWREIRLTAEETRDIVVLRAKELDTKEMIRSLHGLSDGWAAGLILMSEAVKRDRIEPHLIGEHTSDEVFVYFAHEVFERLDAKTQEFLLLTSFLPEMTAPMAEELTGNTSAASILRGMNRDNYFVTARFSPKPVYKYHPLYRDFLRSCARKGLSNETLVSLRRKAARILEEAEQSDAALALLFPNDDWEGMAAIVITHAPQMLKQGRHLPLREWLDKLPSEVVGANPRLLYWKAMSMFPFAPRAARQFFEEAFARFQAAKDQIGSIMAASGAVNAIVYGWDDFAPLDHWYEVLSDFAARIDPFPDAATEASVVASILMAIAMRDMHRVEIGTWEQRALCIPETPSTIDAKFHALHFAFWYRLMTGNMVDSVFFLEELRRLSRVPEAQPLTFIAAWLLELIYHLYTGLHDEVMNAARKGLNAAKKTGIHVQDTWFYANGIVSLLSRMDLKKAEAWFDKVRADVSDWPNYSKSLYRIQLMRMALIRKEPRQALYEGQMALSP